MFINNNLKSTTGGILARPTVKICKNCNRRFIYRVREQEINEATKHKAKRELEWQRAKQKSEEQLKGWNVMPLESILVDEERTLYILGNGSE